MTDAIPALIAGAYPNPRGGPPLGVATRAVAIADSLAGAEAELIAGLGLGRRLSVVCDPTTRAVLGDRVIRALGSIAEVTPVELPEHPHADFATVERLAQATSGADALIAVGSGTINDLCKYVAGEGGKPYAVFATAPSMNGYTSLSAAITVDGLKKSLPAVAAAGVFLDLAVLAAAPPRMIRSGLGDSLCRPTAQADWLLAHLLLDQPYDETPYTLLADDEAALFVASDALLGGDIEAMRRLARTLVLSGFGMSLVGSSQPASQGEHLISHYADMRPPRGAPATFHGEQIGVTTLTMAALQARLLDGPPPLPGPTRVNRADVIAHFGPALGAACWDAFAPKYLDDARAHALGERLERDWEMIRARLAAVVRPPAELRAVLKRAGAPTTPAELGWSADFHRDAVTHARLIRDRYTFLDLALDRADDAPPLALDDLL